MGNMYQVGEDKAGGYGWGKDATIAVWQGTEHIIAAGRSKEHQVTPAEVGCIIGRVGLVLLVSIDGGAGHQVGRSIQERLFPELAGETFFVVDILADAGAAGRVDAEVMQHLRGVA